MDHRVFIFLLVIWTTVEASNTTTKSNWTVLLKVFENCADKNDSLHCLQHKVLNFANRMTQAKSLEIIDGFKFVQDERNARSIINSKPTDLGASLSDQIWNKIGTFFKTHSVEINLSRLFDTDNEARKKKGHGGILLLAAAVKGAMFYMGMHAIAALAGKALIVAKVALTVASVIALKKLLEGSSGKTSYEIIKHPQHTYVQTHSSSHEYGGGGHGGGYEGHYRKRSIAKTKVNLNQESIAPSGLDEASNPWRFELPRKEPSIEFSNTSNDVNQPQQIENNAFNEGDEFFWNNQAVNQNRNEIPKHNLFAFNVENKNNPQEFGGGEIDGLNDENNLTPLQLSRSRLFRFL